MKMVWLLILVVYAAPDDAVNWSGPWTFGMTRVMENHYRSEVECRNSAVELIGRIHEGMRAPIRYRCVQVPGSLPKGAAR